ncbi:MAG: glutamate-1-semialdehyde 2,1-aminomutase [Spirochaetota bacterium]
MVSSQQLFERSQKVAPGGVHSPVRSFASVGGTPVFFRAAKGAYLYDVDKQEYIDFCMSFGPLILGHRDPDIEAVVKEAIETAWTFGACEPYSLELAEFITGEIPWIDKIRFVSSGTEAVMSALRIARAVTGRNKVLKFDGCYHGHLDPLLVKAGSGLAGEASSDSAGIGKTQTENTLVLPLDREDLVAELFQKEGQEIACIIVEPLPANYGLLKQRKEYIATIMEIAQKNGSLIIFDEVISGFRVGMQGMAAHFQAKPDLVTYGKIIGGGFPVGAYAGKQELMDLVAPKGDVYQAGTLSGNPIGMRAGLATLKKLKADNIHSILEKRNQKFIEDFTKILNQKSEQQWRGECQDSLFWLHGKIDAPIRSIEEIPSGHKENFAKLFHALLQEGVYLAPSAYEVGFLSYAHSEEILAGVLQKTQTAVAKL